KDVTQRDSTYWVDNRPTPLTEEESRDYVFKDSIRRRNESKEYLDSVDRKANKFKPLGFLTEGYYHRNGYKKEYLRFGSPLTSFYYFIVEVVAITYSVSYSNAIVRTLIRFYHLSGRVRYGFANKRFNANIKARNSIKKHAFTLSGDSDVVDLNNQESTHTLF